MSRPATARSPATAAAAARLVAGRIAGPAAARCQCCTVDLVDLAAPMRLTVLDENGLPLELVMTHAHSTAGGMACAVPTPVRCARPFCELVAGPGRWCWLCGAP